MPGNVFPATNATFIGRTPAPLRPAMQLGRVTIEAKK
jgi:hypothetical protein